MIECPLCGKERPPRNPDGSAVICPHCGGLIGPNDLVVSRDPLVVLSAPLDDDRVVFPRPTGYTFEFEVHASLESIKAYIGMARTRQSRIQKELGWLEALYVRRAGGAS